MYHIRLLALLLMAAAIALNLVRSILFNSLLATLCDGFLLAAYIVCLFVAGGKFIFKKSDGKIRNHKVFLTMTAISVLALMYLVAEATLLRSFLAIVASLIGVCGLFVLGWDIASLSPESSVEIESTVEVEPDDDQKEE